MKIHEIIEEYRNKLDHLDLELLIAHSLDKTREFILTHPEQKITKNQELKTKNLIARRLKHEPIAYILGQKEFYGLPFKVDQNTLIPRPETELLVEQAIRKIQDTRDKKQEISIIDLGTGSGNIIIALAQNAKRETQNNLSFYGLDISNKALAVAKKNAKLNKADNIKFIKSDLLNYFLSSKNKKLQTKNCIILANLPYLSKEIYSATMPDVKKFEPKSALLSGQDGLDHYRKLLAQIKHLKEKCFMFHVSCFMEISPEQKSSLAKLAKELFPKAKLNFYKDLAQKWRILEVQC